MKIKILIVEHDPVDVELIEHELKKGNIDYRAEFVQTEAAYEKAILEFAPDIILSDYAFPLFDGPTAFKIKERLAPEIPFIFVSGAIGEENSIEQIKNGVTDYVLKDMLLNLPIKITRALKEAKQKKEKLKTEKALISSEKHLARAQQVAHIGSWEMDFNTAKIMLSAEACTMFALDCDQNEQTRDTLLSFVHPDDREYLSKEIDNIRLGFESYSITYRIINKKGILRHIYAEWKIEIDKDGNPTGMLGIYHDVTEIKVAEEKIEFERNNLDALINNTNDVMWSVGRDYNLITSNKRFDELTACIAGNPIARGSSILYEGSSPEMQLPCKPLYTRAFSGEIFTAISHSETPVESWNEISFYPILNGKKVIGTACNSRDITESKRIEQKLELQNKQLTKTNAELDRFVYSVSHDLRSPLTSVLGLVSLIETESKEPNSIHYAEMMRTSVNRLDDFIKNILSYSKNNRTELNIECINLQTTFSEIVDSLRNIQGAEGINFEIEVEETHLFYSDVFRLRTILENLVSNAVKYHSLNNSERYIKINGKSDKHQLQLRIEDNGRGIPQKYHEKIFDMFFRLPGKVSGSGIGLYIVKETIEKLEGNIQIQSGEGNGTSFLITLKNQVCSTQLICKA